MYDGSEHNGGGGAANANSLFGDGGFMPSQSTAVPESGGGLSKVLPNLQFVFASFLRFGLQPLTPRGCSRSMCWQGQSAQTLLPLTVKQIMNAAQASDDKSNFAVNGVEVSTVPILPLRWRLGL